MEYIAEYPSPVLGGSHGIYPHHLDSTWISVDLGLYSCLQGYCPQSSKYKLKD